MEVNIRPIGRVHSPYKSREEIKEIAKENIIGEIEIFSEFGKGLKDIESFSHLWILWIFHLSKGSPLQVTPRTEKNLKKKKLRGVFATRSPNRPNPMALTLVELLEKKGNVLKVRGIDAIEGTPVVDIKPYVQSDKKDKARYGWCEEIDFK